MKKLFFLLCFCFILTQTKAQDLMFGPKIGVNVSQLKTSDIVQLANVTSSVSALRNVGSNYTGFVAGGFLRASFAGFYVQPEVLLSLKGGTFEKVYRTGVGLPASETVKMSMLGVDVPVLLGYKVLAFRVFLGPVANFRISNLDGIKTAISEISNSNNVADSALKRIIWNYQAGVGFDVKKFSVDVRYEGNFSKITSYNLGNGLNLDQSTSLWQITLGYNIL